MTQTYIRNKLSRSIYQGVLKPIFFKRDPEDVHDKMVKVGASLGKTELGRALTRSFFYYENPMLRQNILGIEFKNPIGLSAGFDKNAELTDILSSVGFGFAEVGSITGEPCPGNPRPRLWRLPTSEGLVVYYGLKNDGCEAIYERLSTRKLDIPLGLSVAMTNNKENANLKNAVLDYAKAFRTLEPLKAGYFTINISCPNTYTGQPFTKPHNLDYLLDILDEIPTDKPIFVKLSPDLGKENIDEILEVLKRHRVQGIICTNLTKKRDSSKLKDDSVPSVGGISGKVVQELADDLLSYIYKKEGNRFVLVGSGGVFNAKDAYRKIKLGASLVQMITGMVFGGPQTISEINRDLVSLLEADGYKNIGEAVGKGA